MTAGLLRLLAKLPLSTLHRIGVVIGWLVYFASPVYAKRMRENLAASGLYADSSALNDAVHGCVAETGKAVLETAKIWFGDTGDVNGLTRSSSWNVLEQALAAGRGVLLLSPHLGSFEVAGFYAAQRTRMTALYRPPRLRWLESLMTAGRRRGHATVAPANLRGVRLLYKALKQGEVVGMLPDQAPQVGEGVWTDFFGRPAYTMTLVRRLQKQTGAAVVFSYGERLPNAAGFVVHYERFTGTDLDEATMNRCIEELIRRHPVQYLWSYNRHKIPAGVEPPPPRVA
jgi:KDO2-lipid IV(A) lauroyltransferase